MGRRGFPTESFRKLSGFGLPSNGSPQWNVRSWGTQQYDEGSRANDGCPYESSSFLTNHLSLWHNKDHKAAVESAVAMNDLAVIVDLLGILTLKPAMWNLDLCNALLTPIGELLQSKYEMYITAGSSAWDWSCEISPRWLNQTWRRRFTRSAWTCRERNAITNVYPATRSSPALGTSCWRNSRPPVN